MRSRPIVPPGLWRMSRRPLTCLSKGGSIMSEALLAPLAAWQNYYVIVGTAAATLTGLMFVVIALMAQLRLRPSSWSHMRVFNTSNVVHFGAALLSAPWPALWTAAVLLGL